jgi:hypothetical protein
MFMFLLKGLSIFLMFHFYKNRYPKDFDEYSNQLFEYLKNNDTLKPIMPYIIKIGYTFIYIYSFFQITLNKIIKCTLPYVRSIRDNTCECLIKNNIISDKMLCKVYKSSNINVNIKSVISFFNDGSSIFKKELQTGFKDLTPLDIKTHEPDSYDLLTIKDVMTNTTDIMDGCNIITFANKQIPIVFEAELSNIKFIALYLKYNDKSYSIELFKDNNNYYVVGNVINIAFLKYYLINVLNITTDISSKPFTYTLELMDHNVKMVYINETESIVIQKDDYIIDGRTVSFPKVELKLETKLELDLKLVPGIESVADDENVLESVADDENVLESVADDENILESVLDDENTNSDYIKDKID